MTTEIEPGRPSLAYGQGFSRAKPSLQSRLPMAGFLLLVALSVSLRVYNPSALWLDETLSVNISKLPPARLFSALRQDGSPPLYYLLLHCWIRAFGTGDLAVRLLSSVFSIASLAVVYRLGDRLHGPTAGRMAVLLLGISPFAVRYSTETRMYSLLFLLSAAFLLQLIECWRRPSRNRLAGLALVSGALALTHYWALFLLAGVGGLLLVLSLRGQNRAVARRCLLGVLSGAVVFLPWLPSFVFQIHHTGTPWARPPAAGAVLDTAREWSGGRSVAATIWLIAATVMAVWACIPVRYRHTGLGLELETQGSSIASDRTRPTGVLVAASLATLVIGLAASRALSSGYAFRYSSPALVAALTLAALGLALVPRSVRYLVLILLLVTGLTTSLRLPFQNDRTQAAATAAVIKAAAGPNDLVVYCPDQLGPAVNRLLPANLAQVVYPTLASPQRVDWVDYAKRNEAASVVAIEPRIAARASGAIWLVMRNGYRTFGKQCEQLATLLLADRGSYQLVQAANSKYSESEKVLRFPPG